MWLPKTVRAPISESLTHTLSMQHLQMYLPKIDAAGLNCKHLNYVQK
jgi:hypothetical protein